jgi:hypothetical protein
LYCRHSCESRVPGFFKCIWIPAFAGMTGSQSSGVLIVNGS